MYSYIYIYKHIPSTLNLQNRPKKRGISCSLSKIPKKNIFMMRLRPSADPTTWLEMNWLIPGGVCVDSNTTVGSVN